MMDIVDIKVEPRPRENPWVFYQCPKCDVIATLVQFVPVYHAGSGVRRCPNKKCSVPLRMMVTQ